eukprot:8892776-Lingulodinium_polyedra.AAC.1
MQAALATDGPPAPRPSAVAVASRGNPLDLVYDAVHARAGQEFLPAPLGALAKGRSAQGVDGYNAAGGPGELA